MKQKNYSSHLITFIHRADMEPRNSLSFSWMSGSLHRIIGLGFGSGLSPIAPGTAGTLLGWVLFSIGYAALPNAVLAIAITLGSIYGLWVCGRCSKDLHRPDDGAIVWDEIIAFWIVLIFIMPTNIGIQALAFALFRFFDAIKPGPIGMIDRHFKSIDDDHNSSSILQILWRGFGIMVDDLAAAFFTLLIIALIQRLIPL